MWCLSSEVPWFSGIETLMYCESQTTVDMGKQVGDLVAEGTSSKVRFTRSQILF